MSEIRLRPQLLDDSRRRAATLTPAARVLVEHVITSGQYDHPAWLVDYDLLYELADRFDELSEVGVGYFVQFLEDLDIDLLALANKFIADFGDAEANQASLRMYMASERIVSRYREVTSTFSSAACGTSVPTGPTTW